MNAAIGSVGIFWLVNDVLVAAGCALDDAVPYGNCLTYEGGHAEHWDLWREAGWVWLSKHGLPASILTTEYDDHPRGRIVKELHRFVIYADKRLHARDFVIAICERFGIEARHVSVQSDPHYRSSPIAP